MFSTLFKLLNIILEDTLCGVISGKYCRQWLNDCCYRITIAGGTCKEFFQTVTDNGLVYIKHTDQIYEYRHVSMPACESLCTDVHSLICNSLVYTRHTQDCHISIFNHEMSEMVQLQPQIGSVYKKRNRCPGNKQTVALINQSEYFLKMQVCDIKLRLHGKHIYFSDVEEVHCDFDGSPGCAYLVADTNLEDKFFEKTAESLHFPTDFTTMSSKHPIYV